ncbi:Crp/Fnr family transcriptional regulator [Solimonas soli]|uniref:Crp/Fnr family transcriptional regulator n=1 Tax=Solimonas soli TaxID=413479 RepID=UPI0004887C63|nr:Crp/Fnr family transcriptional regulator [Solimonas soli]
MTQDIDHAGSADPCRNCLRHGGCLGAALQEAEHHADAGVIGVLTLQRGQSLHRIGDNANAVYIVQSGALKSRRHSLQGDEEIVAFRLPGDAIGLDEIGQKVRGTEAVALCTTRVCRLPLDVLRAEMQQSERVAEHLYDDLGHEFERLHERLQNERRSAPSRIAGFLLAQLQRRQRLFGTQIDRFTLPMTRVDLGRFLGLATETVSRMFTRLQLDGVIVCDGASVQVLDAEALRRCAQDRPAADKMARAA